MSLGENLQFLRKKNDITQEQLAERLEVSRQSVSKWESDTTYPEMEKILQLCQMFHCNMDDLVQKDISALYVEDGAQYDKHHNLFSKMITLGVGLILFGLSVMWLMHGIGLGGSMCDELSGVVFFIFVIVAVAIFIVMGLQHSDFNNKHIHIDNFYSTEEIDNFNKKFTVMIAAGVVLILTGVAVMIVAESLAGTITNDIYDYDEILASGFFLFVTVAVCLFTYAGLQKAKYNIEEYNQMHDKESEAYKKDHLQGRICGCIMLTAVIIHMFFGFAKGGWGMPYAMVYPIFGCGCGIVSILFKMK